MGIHPSPAAVSGGCEMIARNPYHRKDEPPSRDEAIELVARLSAELAKERRKNRNLRRWLKNIHMDRRGNQERDEP